MIKFYIGIGTKRGEEGYGGFGTGWGEFYKCKKKPVHEYARRLLNVNAEEFLDFLIKNHEYIEGLEFKTTKELETIVNDDQHYEWESNGKGDYTLGCHIDFQFHNLSY